MDEVCSICGGKGATAPNGVQYCACPADPPSDGEVAMLRADADRLAFLAVGHDASDPYPYLCDGFAGIDLYEQASIYASALGRQQPSRDDYIAAFRDAVDKARADLGLPVNEEGTRNG